MNVFLDLTAFLFVWTMVYLMSEDVLRFLAKHLVFITGFTAVYFGYIQYGSPLQYLGMLLVGLWLITLVLDSLDYFVVEPLTLVIGKGSFTVGGRRKKKPEGIA